MYGRCEKYCTHNNDIKLGTVQLAFDSFELGTYSLHIFRCEALIGDAQVELVHHALADIDPHNGFAVRSELSGNKSCSDRSMSVN